MGKLVWNKLALYINTGKTAIDVRGVRNTTVCISSSSLPGSPTGHALNRPRSACSTDNKIDYCCSCRSRYITGRRVDEALVSIHVGCSWLSRLFVAPECFIQAFSLQVAYSIRAKGPFVEQSQHNIRDRWFVDL